MIGAYIGKKGGVYPYVRNLGCNCFFSPYEMEGCVMICRINDGPQYNNGIYVVRTDNPEETIKEIKYRYA